MSYIQTINDIDLRETGSEELKEMAAENVSTWIENLSEDAWKGIEYDERECRYVATFNFDEFEDDESDSDAALSGMITATVRQFDLGPEDLEGSNDV